jgi:hypothetical protein
VSVSLRVIIGALVLGAGEGVYLLFRSLQKRFKRGSK